MTSFDGRFFEGHIIKHVCISLSNLFLTTTACEAKPPDKGERGAWAGRSVCST